MTLNEYATVTEPDSAVASAKLPDDLEFQEFVDLVDALVVVMGASSGMNLDTPPFAWDLPAPVRKVQYGSDFLVVLSIGASAVGIFLSLSKAVDAIAAAGLKNEERLTKKEERLQRRRERVSDERQVNRARIVTDGATLSGESSFDDLLDARARLEVIEEKMLDRLAPQSIRRIAEQSLSERASLRSRRRLVSALLILAEYGVSIRIEKN